MLRQTRGESATVCVLNRRVDLHAIDATLVDFHTGNDSNKFGFFFCMALSTSENLVRPKTPISKAASSSSCDAAGCSLANCTKALRKASRAFSVVWRFSLASFSRKASRNSSNNPFLSVEVETAW